MKSPGNYHRTKVAQSLSHFILVLVAFSLLLMPTLPLPGLPSVRFDDLLVLGWLFLVFPFLKIHLSSAARFRIAFFILLGFLLPISIFNGLLNGYGGDFSDLKQYVRFLKYAGVYLLAFYVFNVIDVSGLRRFLNAILIFSVLLSILAVSQYLNVLGLNERYVMFVAPTQYQTLVDEYRFPRPVGMVGNPNELAFMFVLLFLFSVYYIKEYSATVLSVCTALFALASVFLTLSRGSVVGLLVGFLLMYVYLLKNASLKVKLSMLFCVFVFFGVLFAFLTYPPVFDQITWRLTGENTDAGWVGRVEVWEQNLSIIRQHYMLGVGPLRTEQVFVAADNEWFLMMRSYGFFGVVLFVGFMVLPLFSRTSASKKALSIGMVSATFLYMIPTAAFHSLVIFPLMLIIFALIDAQQNLVSKFTKKVSKTVTNRYALESFTSPPSTPELYA